MSLYRDSKYIDAKKKMEDFISKISVSMSLEIISKAYLRYVLTLSKGFFFKELGEALS